MGGQLGEDELGWEAGELGINMGWKERIKGDEGKGAKIVNALS